jgi:hybrid cluster-associated redox disulfide protein
MKKKIKGDMTIEQILTKFPKESDEIRRTLFENGMHCVGCWAAALETLEQGAEVHGIVGKEFENLLEKLNSTI